MSVRFSPDGMYYWDGARWLSTLSPDGRFRWDGSSWVPVTHAPSPYVVQPTVREPTRWTRPLQYAVAGWYALSALIGLSLPFWMSGQMSAIMQASIRQQQAQSPDLQPPPQSFYDAMNTMMSVALWIAAIFAFAIALVVVIGALKRWTWMYYAVLVLLGLGVLSEPVNLINFATGAAASNFAYRPPTSIYLLGIASWIPTTALFVVMLVAVIKIGPWAMRKVSAAGSPAA